MFTHAIISACGAFPATPSFSLADSAQEQADPDFPLTFFAFMTLGYEFSFRVGPRVSLFGILRPRREPDPRPEDLFCDEWERTSSLFLGNQGHAPHSQEAPGSPCWVGFL